MKDKTNRHGAIVAAAVLFALGVGPVAAQQTGTEPGAPMEQQETERDWQTEQQRTEREWETEQRQAERERETTQQEIERERQDDEFAREQRDEPGLAEEAQREVAAGAAELEELAREHGNLSKFVEAVKAAGMEESLTDGTRYTIFAPTDEAFEQMDAEVAFESENWEQVAELLRGHIVADDVDRDMLQRLPQAMTIDGGMVEISEREGEIHVQDATVADDEIQIGAVRIYPIDSVLRRGTGAAPAPAQDRGMEDDGFGG